MGSSLARTQLSLLDAPRLRGALCMGRALPAEVTTLLTLVRQRGQSGVGNW